jgi:predicted AlkP superfamily pyrophosphatase or phosphodiesterase
MHEFVFLLFRTNCFSLFCKRNTRHLLTFANMNPYLFLLLLLPTSIYAQQATKKPTLVVGIVVDQMRQEYLYRYESKFSEGGFKRLMREGFTLKNAHYNYTPTVTGPGHASVYTGTTPAIHGIIGNEYYDKQERKSVYCVEDPTQKMVGTEATGGVSPWRMLSTTITDELELFTNKKAKVIAVSIKDRGSVLPAGHMADAAYFPEGRGGKFITSTFYRTTLPDWVNTFNSKNLPALYVAKPWTTLLPIDQYTESGSDDSPYERKFKGKEKMTFPYNFAELVEKNGGELFSFFPYANDYITEFAKAALAGEQMGKDQVSDFLAISFSSPDILGHAVGPRSVELQDMYLRLDKNIEDLLKTLDKEVGVGNYTVFLTADHAVAEVPQFLKDNKVPAGYFNEEYATAKLNEYLATYYPGKKLIEKISNEQVFLNHNAFDGDPRSTGLDLFVVGELVGKFLMTLEGVTNYYTEAIIKQSDFDEGGIKGKIIRGHHPKRSGDIAFVLNPAWFEGNSVQGTTHGSPYNYDTHVPILFFGCGVKQGASVQYHPITDIAPTVSVILSIMFPSGCTGQPIGELLK